MFVTDVLQGIECERASPGRIPLMLLNTEVDKPEDPLFRQPDSLPSLVVATLPSPNV